MNAIRAFLLLALVTAPMALAAAQPNIKGAHENLRAALRHVLNSANEKPKHHLDSAATALQMAQARLETARKNKGSHANVAVEKIQAALKEVELARKNSASRDKAAALIKSAIVEVEEAGRAGRR